MKRTTVYSVLLLSLSLCSGIGATRGDDGVAPTDLRQDGRPAAAVPGVLGSLAPTPPAPGVVSATPPAGPQLGGVLYEPNRIKRTVSLDPTVGLDGVWDPLYSYVDTVDGTEQAGGSGVRTAYFDWDENFLYLAIELPKATSVRFDIDGKNDGWLRGADNLALTISPPSQPGGAPTVDVQRFDAVQNPDAPVFAASPIPASVIKAQAGTTPRGTYAVTVALPQTELIGLLRKRGSVFGVRVQTGVGVPQDQGGDVILLRPMLHLTLADAIPATAPGGLLVRVSVNGSRSIAPGEDCTLRLEARNEGASPIALSGLYLRGSLGSTSIFDSANFNGITILPGQKFARELQSSMQDSAPTGDYVASGGAVLGDGTTLTSLVSIDRIEPFSLDTVVDLRPVNSHKAPDTMKNLTHGWLRQTTATIVGRLNAKTPATVRIELPQGWSLDGGDTTRTMTLRYDGDTQTQVFRVVVPVDAAAGDYKLKLTLDAGGRSYASERIVTVQ